jgi:hypothetical protein
MAGARRCFSDAARGPAISGRDKPDRRTAIIGTGIPTRRAFRQDGYSNPSADPVPMRVDAEAAAMERWDGRSFPSPVHSFCFIFLQ